MQITTENWFPNYDLRHSFLLFCLIFLTSLQIFAEKLPLKIYTSADGLANDTIERIYADSRGFLWFATEDGLSRFDGYRFKNYTQEQGLPHRRVSNFLETKDGDYLIATPNGLAVFNPAGKAYRWNIIEEKLEQNAGEPPLFKTYVPPNDPSLTGSKNVFSLAQDGNGNIYASTRYNLFRFVKTADAWQFQKVEYAPFSSNKTELSEILFTDSRGDVWFGMAFSIYRISKNGEIEKVSEPGGNAFFEDKDGDIWVNSGGHDLGIRVFSVQNNKPVRKNLYTRKDGLFMNGFTNAIVQDNDGTIFVTSGGKLFRFNPNAKENELKFLPLENDTVHLAVKKDQTIWFSIAGKGAARYSPNSFYTFDEKDGLPKYPIGSIFGNKNGEVFLSAESKKLIRINDKKIEEIEIADSKGRYWIEGFYDLQSRDGEFWLSTTDGLFRFPQNTDFRDLSRIKPKKIYTTADGFYSNQTFAVFEDSRGDIWISSVSPENSVLRWEKSTDKIYRYTDEYGLPKGNSAVSFGEDSAGNIWIGFYFGEIFRFKDGKFRDFTNEGLIQRNFVTRFLSNKNGRLWLSTSSRGLFRVDNPNDETPVFTNFSTANGLSSNQTNCLAEDKFGRIYVTTGRGINRLEPDTERIKIFTQNDGLPGNLIRMCYADANGNLWFSSINSLIKYTPEAEKPSAPPPILIDSISVNGKPQPVSELGEKEIKNLELNSDERQIQIGFFAISFEAGENLRYQYKLGEQDWSPPNQQRTVDFNLSPGTYNFAVRAVTADGVLSENSATVTFTIARPIWQRWWFIVSFVSALAITAFLFYRYRIRNLERINAALTEAKTTEEKLSRERNERLTELQKVRTRIATDLHDDIGSSLTQISVLSGVARREILEKKTISVEPLESISSVSNELVEAMSDIVWAINPRKDSLRELIFRMRRFASDVLTAGDIEFDFETPDVEEQIQLGANIRREVFAIFKECVNNIVRHSGAKNVEIVLELRESEIILKIADDGHGFEMEKVLAESFLPDKGGNGLINMRRRAKDLGGVCEINSNSHGTTTIFKIPFGATTENTFVANHSVSDNGKKDG